MIYMKTPSYNKLCEVEDYDDAEVAQIVLDAFRHERHLLAPGFPKRAELAKYWESAMAVRALRHFDVLRSDATLLCTGAGTQVLPFYLTHYVNQVFATDLYLAPSTSRESAPSFMLTDPAAAAPYAFDAQRLVVQHMDSRALRYPENHFDAIVSLGAIEQLGSIEYIANAAYELGRVLKPGGILSLTTKYRMYGPPGGVGWNGCILLSREDIQRYIIEASGLQAVDELRTDLSERTLSSKRDLTTYAVDKRLTTTADRHSRHANALALARQPALVQVYQGYVFCSVHLTLQKTAHYPARANQWAMPSVATIEIAHSNSARLSFSSLEQLPREAIGSRLETIMNVSNNTELTTIRNLLTAWDGARIRGWYNPILRRLPFGLAKLGRTIVRVMQLGRVFDAQAQLYAAMITHQDTLNTRIQQLTSHLATLETHMGGISSKTDMLHQQTQHLAAFTTQLGDLSLKLERLDVTAQAASQQQQAASQQQMEHQAQLARQLEEIAVHQAQLETQLQEAATWQVDMDHQVRLNTSYVRLFQQQFKRDSSDEQSAADQASITGAELVELLRTLEQASAKLAQSVAIELSIQDGMAEDSLMAGATYFGERMSSAGATYRVPNDACYHIDLTNEWSRQGLLASAVSRLQDDGIFVIVTAPEYDTPGSIQQLELIEDRMLTLGSGRQLRAYLWRRI